MPVTVTPIRLPATPPPAPVPEAHGPVTRGQLLAELDAAQLDARDRTIAAGIGAHDAQLVQAALDIDYAAKNAAAGVAAAEAFLSGAQARLVRATAVLANAQADDERAATLYVARRVSKQR